MTRKKNNAETVEELKKKTAEELSKKLATVKSKQDAINESLQRLQEMREADPDLLGRGKTKHLAAATSTLRTIDSQQNYIRNMLDGLHVIFDEDYSVQISDEISRRDLMELIKTRGDELPLWVKSDSQFPGESVGALAPKNGSKLNEGDAVAALSKDGDWILADVVTCHSNSRYECRDVDGDKKALTFFSRNHLLPLPKFKANPVTDSHALFKKKAIVLALYPQTTCFYKGIVETTPTDPRDSYHIAFEDDSYPSGYCPPMEVAQKYVIAYRDANGIPSTSSPKKSNNHKKKNR